MGSYSCEQILVTYDSYKGAQFPPIFHGCRVTILPLRTATTKLANYVYLVSYIALLTTAAIFAV